MGPVEAWHCVKEWQKRSFSHAHCIIYLEKDDKETKCSPDNINRMISAEIPDPKKNPRLYKIITQNMVHGPCGELNPDCVCMKKGVCTKNFPKPFCNQTTIGENCYPEYKRRSPENGGNFFYKNVKGKNIKIDNRWIVPYSPFMSLRYNCHINWERIISSGKCIAYLYKYQTKGVDKAMLEVNEEVDEISDFIDGRYISSSEAADTILELPRHLQHPPTLCLQTHLPDQQKYIFDAVDGLIPRDNQITHLTAFFDLNNEDPLANCLLFKEVVKYYRFMKFDGKLRWVRRSQGVKDPEKNNLKKADFVGYTNAIVNSVKNKELYSLQVLLSNKRGPKSFDDLKTFNGICYPTFLEAAISMGLLISEEEPYKIFDEAINQITGKKLRKFYVRLTIEWVIAKPHIFFEKYRPHLREQLKYTEIKKKVF